jgi:hypothetical protein
MKKIEEENTFLNGNIQRKNTSVPSIFTTKEINANTAQTAFTWLKNIL